MIDDPRDERLVLSFCVLLVEDTVGLPIEFRTSEAITAISMESEGVEEIGSSVVAVCREEAVVYSDFSRDSPGGRELIAQAHLLSK